MKSESFGYKNAWFACRTDSSLAVACALRLVGAVPMDWEQGIGASYAQEEPSSVGPVFVTSPVDGWVMAVGTTLFALCDTRPSAVLEWCASLSQALGGAEVQFFATHRVVEAHAWGKAKDGLAIRAYVLVDGEALEDFGGQTVEEKSLGFKFFDHGAAEAEAENYYDREDLEFPGEEHVMRLAAAWSVNPSEFEERGLDVEPGLLGTITLAQHRLPEKPAAVESVASPQPPETPDKEKITEARTSTSADRPWWRFW